jgi:hypothetical protein
VRPVGISLRQVYEQLHHRNGSLSQMKNDLNKTFRDFSMRLCDLRVGRPPDLPTVGGVETFSEFRDNGPRRVARLRDRGRICGFSDAC